MRHILVLLGRTLAATFIMGTIAYAQAPTSIATMTVQPQRVTEGTTRWYVYSVKFLVGISKNDPSEKVPALGPGYYATVVNIHNPNSRHVKFRKRAVWSRREPRDGVLHEEEVRPWHNDALGHDFLNTGMMLPSSMFVDGFTIIRELLGLNIPLWPQLMDGWLIIHSRMPLDVQVVYTVSNGP